MRFLFKLAVVAATVGWALDGRATATCAPWLTDDVPGATFSNPGTSEAYLISPAKFFRQMSHFNLFTDTHFKKSHKSQVSAEEMKKIEEGRQDQWEDYTTTTQINNETIRISLSFKFPPGSDKAEPLLLTDNSYALLEINRPIDPAESEEAAPAVPLFYRGPILNGKILYDRYSSYIKDADGGVYEISASVLFENQSRDLIGAKWAPLHVSEVAITRQQR